MKPPFTYYGGKTSLAPTIARLLPPHKTYVEPFFGSGAVLFAKPPSVHEIINDLDGALVAFWRCLRDRLPELERACALTPYARDEWAGAELTVDVEDLELARRFWVKVAQSFGHSVTAGYAYAIGQNTSRAKTILAGVDRFGPAADRLAAVAIENTDALRLIDRFDASDVLFYIDPPYDRAGRVSADDYRHEMSEVDHQAMADRLMVSSAAVIVSGYGGSQCDELYAGWHRYELEAIHTERTEVLWSNRPLAVAAPPPSLFGALS